MLRLALAVIYLSGLRQGEVLLHSASRFDPTRSLTRGDMYIKGNNLHPFIKSAKNLKQYDMRRTVVLQPTGDPLTCPVVLYRDMITMYPTTHPRQPALIRGPGLPLTVAYTTSRLRHALSKLGADPNQYTLHSLRLAAATDAFQQDIDPLHVQHSAAWSSQAYVQYIHADSQLRVNTALSKTLSFAH